MLRYLATVVTDVGNVKRTNQDSVCVKVAQTEDKGQVAMIVICDGMGGLEKGELASSVVVKKFDDWFENTLPLQIQNYQWNDFAEEWVNMISGLNSQLLEYGKEADITLGTTITGMLIIEDEYMIVHVGDTRLYEIREGILQLTEDQTFVAQEIKRGNMTLEQAQIDYRKNMLLQCVGASTRVIPDVIFGKVFPKTVFLACSDGFRHVVTEEELYEQFAAEKLQEENMWQRAQRMVEVVKSRDEKDNITVALLKCME